MNNEEKLQIYSCLKRQFTDPGLYKSSRIYDWLFTNGFTLENLGYKSFEELCEDFPEVFMFQENKDSGFVLIKEWLTGESSLSEGHPADSFFGTRNLILNDDIIEMTQQSLYALTKILGNNFNVQQMKQDIFYRFEEAKQADKLDFLGEKYVFPIDYCQDGQLVNGIITKNLNAYGKSLYFSFEKTRIFRNPSSGSEKKSSFPKIPAEEKKRIFDLLSGNFPMYQPLHMAAVSKFLTDRGVDRIKYGFGKMKDFLAHMPFLELKEIILGGVPQILITINDYKDAETKENIPQVSEQDNYKSLEFGNLNGMLAPEKTFITKAPSHPEKKVPEGKLTDFCNLPVKPMTILERFISESGAAVDFYKLSDALSEDFETARLNGTIRVYNGKIIFPCRYKKSDGTDIELTLKPSAYDGKEWFLYYVDTFVRENNLFLINCPKQLEEFAYISDKQEMLSSLANMAVDEEWDFCGQKSYYILDRYLKHTFSKIAFEKKLCVSHDKDFAAFNTGLVDKRYDYIYACFTRIDYGNAEWKFAGFCTEFSSILGKHIAEIFNPLPSAPVYFARNDDLIFDFIKYLHIDYESLFSENIQRFPLDFLYEQLFDNQEARGIVNKLHCTDAETEITALYDRIKEIVKSNSRLSFRIQNCLKSAAEIAKKRVKWNYKTAIPAYYPKHSAPALLLPLALADEQTPDSALVLEITRLGSYQARTILSLSQAYICARLVCRLSDDWLDARALNLELEKDEEISNGNY